MGFISLFSAHLGVGGVFHITTEPHIPVSLLHLLQMFLLVTLTLGLRYMSAAGGSTGVRIARVVQEIARTAVEDVGERCPETAIIRHWNS